MEGGLGWWVIRLSQRARVQREKCGRWDENETNKKNKIEGKSTLGLLAEWNEGHALGWVYGWSDTGKNHRQTSKAWGECKIK